MRDVLLKIFSATQGSASIELFSFWHFFYLILIIGGSIFGAFLLKNKKEKAKDFTLKLLAWLIPAVYIADFLIMPLASSDFSINVDKLPFHICTLMAFFVPFVQFNKKFKPIEEAVCCLTMAGSLMYLCYPGTAIGDILPWCYKIVQTFLYHGLMFAWAFLSLATGRIQFKYKTLWKCFAGIAIIIVWASFGNAAYSHSEHHYDWFFVTGSTFPFIPEALMPLTVFVAVGAMCSVLHVLYYWAKTYFEQKAEKLSQTISKTTSEITSETTSQTPTETNI